MNNNQDIKDNVCVDLTKLKTRLCKNLGKCMFGETCHYAHSIPEIVPVPCAYNNECIFIYNTEEKKCLNANLSKICFFKHPYETTESYHIRVGNLKTDIQKPSQAINPIKVDLDDWSTVVRGRKNTIKVQSVGELYVKHDDENIITKVKELIKNKTSKITLLIDYS